MPTQQELNQQRKQNQVRYALEDYRDSIGDLRKVAIGHLLFAAFWFISIIAGSIHNWSHIIVCLFIAIALFLVTGSKHWSFQTLGAVTGGYLLSLIIEAVAFGLPDILIPALNMHKWRGLPIFVNEITPYVYWAVRVILLGFFVVVWVKRSTLLRQDDSAL